MWLYKLRCASVLAVVAYTTCLADNTVKSSDEAATSTGTIQNIVVTAQRRSETLQEVPLSISAIDGKTLAELGGNGFESFASRIPGLQLYETAPNDIQFTIRGISTGSATFDQIEQSSTVGIYFDELPTDISGNNPNYQLFDLERVEVLRGPQGTLFGSGSEAGVVRLIPRRPDLEDFGIGGGVTVSNTHGGRLNDSFDTSINIPIIKDVVALRATAYSSDYDGYIKDIATGDNHANKVEISGGRVALRAVPTPDLTIDLLGVYQKMEQFSLPLYVPSLGDLVTSYGAIRPRDDKNYLSSATLKYDPSTYIEVTSITGWQNWHGFNDASLPQFLTLFGLPADIAPLRFYTYQQADALTQELRIQSRGDHKIDWIAGAFFSHIQRDLFQTIDVPGIESLAPIPPASTFDNPQDRLLDTYFKTNNQQVAGFGELTWHATDALKATFGARYYDSRAHANFVDKGLLEGGIFISDRESKDTGVNPKVNIAYNISKDSLIYAQAARGFRLGGPNYLIPPALCENDVQAIGYASAPVDFKSDYLWSYEVGSKNKFADQTVTLNSSLFLVDWKNIQTLINLPCGYLFQDNLGKARSKGVETELAYQITRELTLGASITYNDSKMLTSIPSIGLEAGTATALTPLVSGNAYLDFRHALSDNKAIFFSADAQHVGSRQTTVTAVNNFTLDAYTIGNLRGGIAFKDWETFLFLNNLSDTRAQLAKTSAFLQDVEGTEVVVARPRTVGVTLRKNF